MGLWVPRPVSCPHSVTRQLPSLLPGSGGLRSPAFSRYYEAATTTELLSPLSLCRVERRYLGRFCGFAPGHSRIKTARPGCCSLRLTHRRSLLQGRFRFSHVPREPHCALALLYDSGRTSAPSLYGASVLPPLLKQRGLQRCGRFRSSITRLRHWLFTLPAAISGDEAKLASGGGQPFRVGL